MSSFRVREVLAIFKGKLTYRNIQHWDKTGIIDVSREKRKDRPRKERRFSFDNVVRLHFLLCLRDLNISLQAIRSRGLLTSYDVLCQACRIPLDERAILFFPPRGLAFVDRRTRMIHMSGATMIPQYKFAQRLREWIEGGRGAWESPHAVVAS